MKNKFSDVREADVCMIDGELVKEGYRVDENDVVINLIRNIKSRLGKTRNNRLYVCKNHYESYIKKRKSYERLVLIVGGLIGALFIFGVIVPALSGSFSIFSIVSFVMISVVMIVLIGFLHVPKVGEKLIYLSKTPKNKDSKKTKQSKQKKRVKKNK